MSKWILGVGLSLTLAMGCLSMPPVKTMDPTTGAVVELSPEERIVQLEAEAAQLQATIASLETAAPFLPPPLGVIALGVLASVSATLQVQKKKLKDELLALQGTSETTATDVAST